MRDQNADSVEDIRTLIDNLPQVIHDEIFFITLSIVPRSTLAEF